MNQLGFVVPGSLKEYVDDGIREAHETLAEMTVSDVNERMYKTPIKHVSGDADFVDLAPYDDHDRTTAVAMPFPYGNGWALHMAIRAYMAQDSMDEPTRFILFPNNKRAYDLSKEDLTDVASGNFAPIAKAQLDTLNNLGIEKVHYVGYSQGATVGAAALKLAAHHDMFELGNSGFFEPPNVEGRTPVELQKLFIKSGKWLDGAVNDSSIPALSEVQHSRGGLDLIAKYVNLLPIVINSQTKVNKAIHQGFTYPYFLRDVKSAIDRDIDGNLNVLVGSGVNSLITPIEFMDNVAELSQENQHIQTSVVEHYGHEMGDNVVLHAVLAKLALKNTQ